MRTILRITSFVTALAVVGVLHITAQTPDPVLGTWELNVAKSKFNPGPGPKSETRTYVAAGNEIKATSKSVDANGKATTGAWTINYDGKDRPATGLTDGDSLALKRIDAFSAEFTQKKAGKVVATGKRVISKDGKIMTITTTGTGAKGTASSTVQVFEKR